MSDAADQTPDSIPDQSPPRRGSRAIWPAFLAGFATAAVLLAGVSCNWVQQVTGLGGGGGPVAPAPPPASYQTETGEPIIRVRLERAARSAIIEGPGVVTVTPVRPAGVRTGISSRRSGRDEPVVLPTPITVEVSAGSWRVEGAGGRVELIPRVGNTPHDDALRIVSPRGLSGDGSPLRVTVNPPLAAARADGSGGETFTLPGEVWLHGVGGGEAGATRAAPRFDVVERLPVEAYVPGVIAKELYPNWSLHAFKAQAVAARSYALHERQRRMALGSHFDVESTTRDQVYGGMTDNETALRASRLTRGEVLTWRGHLLRAYYSSTTGGRAASAADVWPVRDGWEFNLMPPIQASPRDDADAFSPLYRWTVTRDRRELTRRIRAYGVSQGFAVGRLSRLARIEVTERNAFGRPSEHTIYDSDGRSWTLPSEHMRLACNATAGDLPSPSRDKRVNSSDMEFEIRGDLVTITGRGFGHGVGMSQFGAEGMSRQGRTYREILAHYYPGADVEDRF
jgi:SpoIID/LytB domain protein